MKSVCVFCGSKSGKKEIYTETARGLGHLLAEKNLDLVYGGASIGIMGTVADATLEKGGNVHGIIPQSIFDYEVAHENLTNLHVVDSMHERKQKMYDLSDAFFAIPGGMGTLDELCEIVTWCQLQYHTKPIYVVNIDGFFDNLMRHFRYICDEGFMDDKHLKLIIEKRTAEEAIAHLLQE